MSHVIDDLELYGVGALPMAQRTAIARHLEGCASCGARADEVAEVVALLPDAIPPRDPPPGLKARILEAARAETASRRGSVGFARLLRRAPMLAMAAAVVLLLGLDVNASIRLREAEAERDRYAAMAERFSQGGRWWYMAGVDEWTGMGGTLVVPTTDRRPFVLFHDLRALDAGQVYALWLIAPDGQWVRGTSFRAEGSELQLVEVGRDLGGFERCAVTVETSTTGKREGPIVMQSRIAPAQQ